MEAVVEVGLRAEVELLHAVQFRFAIKDNLIGLGEI